MTKNTGKKYSLFLKTILKGDWHLYRMQKKTILDFFFCSLSYFLELTFRLAVRKSRSKVVLETTQNL